MESSFLISQGLFIKSIGLIYFIAFFSLKVQVLGLYGSQGVHSIQNYLKFVKLKYKRKDLYFRLPTFFWLNTSDKALVFACWAGMFLSVLTVFGMMPSVCLLLLLLLYYSFIVVGSPFLNFQWDILLIETGFATFLYSICSPPPLLLVYWLWVLLFRLIFSSGLTKLIHGSREWRDLTAMDYHYETQPLPTVLGYYAHQMPRLFSKLSVIGVYFFELIVPLFIISPPSIRVLVCILLIFFQLLIMLTGNYAFFNLLTIFLCIPLLPDQYLEGVRSVSYFIPAFENHLSVVVILNGVGAFFIFLNLIELLATFLNVGRLYRFLYPFRLFSLINPYGLFVHMTTWRDEIIIEGSEDGENWKAYAFQWKPGDPSLAPRWVAPHQPRLDWQMWFAALGTYDRNPWLESLLEKLMEGSPKVIKLLKTNPFKEAPPRYLRTKVYRYHFTDLKTKKETGQWWTRQLIGEYGPREYSQTT